MHSHAIIREQQRRRQRSKQQLFKLAYCGLLYNSICMQVCIIYLCVYIGIYTYTTLLDFMFVRRDKINICTNSRVTHACAWLPDFCFLFSVRNLLFHKTAQQQRNIYQTSPSNVLGARPAYITRTNTTILYAHTNTKHNAFILLPSAMGGVGWKKYTRKINC